MLTFFATNSGNYEIVVTLENRLINAKGYDQIGISYRVSSVEPRK
jgi:hypothetical protein